ncbi:MAG: spermidine synthase [Acidobacteriota bacterium]|nr:spermidine synthase [Acidobacteriota bacterium]MDH3530502.1 spermidine synthase [Acidobacteriota bacterium]
MSIEELAYHKTRLGDLILRRRPEPLLKNIDVYEVKLGDEFLMSSLFTAGEEALAELGLNGLEGDLEVVVGGLGLGYTAAAALAHKNVKRLLVVEAFEEVIQWHKNELVPVGAALGSDPRCEFAKGDFFELSASGFDADDAAKLWDAVLLDIDHTPVHHLDKGNAGFYTAAGLNKLSGQLKRGGVFALWSDDQSDDDFVNLLREVFEEAAGHDIKFPNPYTNRVSINSVYVARKKS